VAFSPPEIVKSAARIVLLSGPKAIGAFASEPVPVLNMSLWTIRYEFICYLLVPLIVVMIAKRRAARAGVTVLFLLALAWHASQGEYFPRTGRFDIPILGSGDVWPRFLAHFLGGMVVAFNRDIIPFRHWIAALCAISLVVTAIFGWLYIALATAGIYLIFYAAYQRNVPTFGIGDKVDLSYGVYLYAWPVQMLLIQNLRETHGPWPILWLTLPCVVAVSAMSWYFVESPFMAHKARLLRAKRDAKLEAHLPERAVEPAPVPRLVFGRSAPATQPPEIEELSTAQ
jgi:peptidoglycan/LPS O-acetylase OafA/YrhL